VRFEVLGSFCNFVCGGEGRDILAERCGQALVNNGVGLQNLQLLKATMEDSLDAGVVAGETVELDLEVVVGQEVFVRGSGTEFGFHAADAAKVPGGGH